MATYTKQEFIAYWLDTDGDDMTPYESLREWLFENEAQYRNECAMFGDAGVGQGYRLNAAKAEFAKVTERLKQFGAL